MMTIVVASLVERSIAGASRSSTKAFDSGADAVEIRMDHVKGVTRTPDLIDDLRSAVEGTAIATYRSEREGGRGRLVGDAREKLLSRIMDAGFEYVDLELVGDRALLNRLADAKGRTKVIASYHFSRAAGPARVASRLAEACACADIGKVAMPCDHAGHALSLAEIGMGSKRRKEAFAIMGMGVQGQLTRVCAKEIGSRLVYACLPGKPAAPGQLEVGPQKRMMAKESLKLGLIGHPVGHSASKPMHEAALKSAGLHGTYAHLDLPTNAMTKQALTTLFDLGFKGLNVTIPHKERAHRLCDSVERSARSTEAVNTLYVRRGRIVGENTDVFGFKKLLEQKKVTVKDARTLVIGAGGAARAVCDALASQGAAITIAARRPKRAARLAKKFGANLLPLSAAGRTKGAHAVVVNSTPMGTKGSALENESVPSWVFEGCDVFIDLVYNPEVTRSMEAARRNGCVVHGGLEMLVCQGSEAFRIWTGETPDVARMRLAARRALRQ